MASQQEQLTHAFTGSSKLHKEGVVALPVLQSRVGCNTFKPSEAERVWLPRVFRPRTNFREERPCIPSTGASFGVGRCPKHHPDTRGYRWLESALLVDLPDLRPWLAGASCRTGTWTGLSCVLRL